MMRLAAAGILFLLLVGRSGAADSGLPAFTDDLDRESLRLAIQRSLDFLGKVPPERVVGDRPRKLTAQEIKESLLSFLDLLELWDRPEMLGEAIRSRFDFFPSMDEPAEILLTGYYQPVMEGSLTSSEVFRFPVYGKPKDLVEAEMVTLLPERRAEKIVGFLDQGQFVPYFSRHEIDRLGALKGKGYE